MQILTPEKLGWESLELLQYTGAAQLDELNYTLVMRSGPSLHLIARWASLLQ